MIAGELSPIKHKKKRLFRLFSTVHIMGNQPASKISTENITNIKEIVHFQNMIIKPEKDVTLPGMNVLQEKAAPHTWEAFETENAMYPYVFWHLVVMLEAYMKMYQR